MITDDPETIFIRAAAGPGFKRALRTWYELNIEAINLFKGRNDEKRPNPGT